MTNHKPDHDRDRGPDNDNDGRAITLAPTGSALTSLSKLDAMMSRVNFAAVINRSSGRPTLLYHSRDGGTWTFGQKKTVVEDGSTWAVNPLTFQWGYVCWNDDNKATEVLVSVSEPMPAKADLPNTGFEWHAQLTVDMKCCDGTDAGVEVIFKTNTEGGKHAVLGLIEKVQNRLGSGQHGGDIVPIVRLDEDSYIHPKHSRIGVPVLTVVGWMSIDGSAPAPAPASPPPPTEQPRRRRVA
jgi:hypothetical protein